MGVDYDVRQDFFTSLFDCQFYGVGFGHFVDAFLVEFVHECQDVDFVVGEIRSEHFLFYAGGWSRPLSVGLNFLDLDGRLAVARTIGG